MATRTRTGARPGPAARRRLGIFRLADPKITLASAASMLLGFGAAVSAGPPAWGWLALTVLGIFCVEAAKNASGEIVDFDSGADLGVAEADQSPFSGGKKVLVDGLLTRRETALVAAVFYVLGAGAGLVIVALREPAVLWLGVVGIGLAFFYHAPPLRLSYRGLGEAAVALAYGPVIACGTYLVQRGRIDPPVILASLPLGGLIAAFLVINELPDRKADAAAGKRTLVVRLGARGGARLFAGITLAAWGGLLVLPLFGVTPWVLLGLVGLPPGVRAMRRLQKRPDDTPFIVPAQAAALASFVLMAAGAAAGLVLGR